MVMQRMLLWRRHSVPVGKQCLKVLSPDLFVASQVSHGRRLKAFQSPSLPLVQHASPSSTLPRRWFSGTLHPRLSRGISSGTAENLSENYVEENADAMCRPTALSEFHRVVQVCEILEERGWGPDVEARLEGMDTHSSSSSLAVAKVIAATSSPLVSLEFFNWLTRKGFEQDVHTYGTAINMLGAGGHIDRMKELADEMQKSAVTLNSSVYEKLIYWCARNGDAEGAVSFSDRMKQDGYALSATVYTSMFDLHVREEKYEEAVTLFLQMAEESILPTSETLASLTRCLLHAGKLEAAKTVFNSLSSLKVKPSKSTYAYLMGACAKAGNFTLLHEFGKEMRKSHRNPGKVFCTMVGTLQRDGKEEEAEAFAAQVWPELLVEERRLFVKNSSSVQLADEINLLEEHGNVISSAVKVQVSLPEVAELLESEEGFSGFDQLNVDWTNDATYSILKLVKGPEVAWKIFQRLKSHSDFKHDIYNEIYMLHLLAKSSKLSALKVLLGDMQSRGVQLSLETLNGLIDDSVSARSSKAALWVFSQLKKFNLQPNEITFSLLIHALAIDRNPDKALELCSVMQDVGLVPGTECYTAIIHSLGLSGRSDDAWSIYQRMLAASLQPNSNTYTALLNVMDVVGDTGFAAKLYKEMTQNGIEPSEASQGIMVRLWEKAGNLVDAQKLEMQRKFSSAKKREDVLQNVYEVLLEGLVEQERSSSLLCLI